MECGQFFTLRRRTGERERGSASECTSECASVSECVRVCVGACKRV